MRGSTRALTTELTEVTKKLRATRRVLDAFRFYDAKGSMMVTSSAKIAK